ncbi:MAG: hypothetical protein WBM69_07685 [Desulfobacterales bacterium]
MTNTIQVDIAEGAEEIGLAVMLRDLLIQNLEQNPHKISDFSKLNIPIGLHVFDVEIKLTLDFSNESLTIINGVTGQGGLNITADSGTLMNLSNQRIKWGLPYYFDETGKEILAAMKSGRLKVKGMLRYFPTLIRFSRVMSVH